MKKLNSKQMKEIKAGAGITGAFLSGIGGIFKGIGSIVKVIPDSINATFHGITSVANTIGGWIVGARELNKGHAKVTMKMDNGKFEITTDDTQAIKSAEQVETERIKAERDFNIERLKQARLITASPKHTLLALDETPKVEVSDLGKGHSEVVNHQDDMNLIVDDSMNMVDSFMHF